MMKLTNYELGYRSILALWLIFMLAFSGDFTQLKFALLILLILYSVVDFLLVKPKISYRFFFLLVSWVTVFLFSYLYGLDNGFEFSINLFNYVIITPLICVLLSINITPHRLFFIHGVLVFSTILILIINLYYIGFRLNLFAMPDTLLRLATFGGTKIGDEQLEVRLTSQASLVFLLPYVSTFYFLDSKANKNIFGLIIFFGLIVVFFSGRRALQILFFLGMISNFIFYSLKYRVSFKKTFKALCYSVFFVFLFFIVSEATTYFTELRSPLSTFLNTIILSFSSSEGGGIQRYEQSVALWEYFSESPLIGHGLNSHPSYIRNVSEPWSYEWVYLALLAQGGVFVFLFTMFLFFSIAFSLICKFKRNNGSIMVVFAAILNGYVCFIIAGGTNPMVYFSWFWFLVFIGFNECFMNENSLPS